MKWDSTIMSARTVPIALPSDAPFIPISFVRKKDITAFPRIKASPVKIDLISSPSIYTSSERKAKSGVIRKTNL